jgi:tryptophan-rich sensory protein
MPAPGQSKAGATARTRLGPIVIWVLLCEAVGWIAGLVTETAIGDWYQHLAKPAWTPPDIVFPVTWTILYALMGVAAGLVAQRPRSGPAIGLFLLQLGLNALWTPIFFGLRAPAPGFAVIVLLLLAVLATLIAFARHSRTAGWLMLPYLAWVAYASTLNLGIWMLNHA